MKKKQAFSYIRMSTEAQLKGHSLQRQMEMARSYAKEKDFALVEDLRDIGLSAFHGANTKKGKLGVFLKALEDGKIEKGSVLLVENLDRLSRQDPMRAFAQFGEILQYGIEIHTISDKQIYTTETLRSNSGQLFMSLGHMLRAHSESEEKSKRLKKSWQNKHDNVEKRIYTSICPAWLSAKKDKTGFEEIPENVKAIKKIFDLCIDSSMGAFSIARYLNKHIDEYPRFTLPKKRHRGKNGNHKTGWQSSYVLKILNNTAVHGEFCPHHMRDGRREPTEDIYTNYFPVIISQERFLLAQSKRRQRLVGGGGRKGEQFGNVFTKLIVCGRCDGMIHLIDKGKSPKGGKYLRCHNAVSNYGCKCSAWPYKNFEKNFFEFVSEVEFETVLSNGNDKSFKEKLLEDQLVNAEKIEKSDAQFEKIFQYGESASDPSSSAAKKIKEKLQNLSVERDNLDKRKKEIEIELSDIDARNSTKTQKDLIEAIRQQQKIGSVEESASIRRRIHSRIGLVVEKIVMHNFSADFLYHESYEMLSPNVRNMLAEKGCDTEEAVIKLFDHRDGKNLFERLERYFTVHFKNGQIRHVHPALKGSWKYLSNRDGMLRLKKVGEDRIARESLQKRNATSKYIKMKKVKKEK